jgi:hypothetical protein
MELTVPASQRLCRRRSGAEYNHLGLNPFGCGQRKLSRFGFGGRALLQSEEQSGRTIGWRTPLGTDRRMRASAARHQRHTPKCHCTHSCALCRSRIGGGWGTDAGPQPGVGFRIRRCPSDSPAPDAACVNCDLSASFPGRDLREILRRYN